MSERKRAFVLQQSRERERRKTGKDLRYFREEQVIPLPKIEFFLILKVGSTWKKGHVWRVLWTHNTGEFRRNLVKICQFVGKPEDFSIGTSIEAGASSINMNPVGGRRAVLPAERSSSFQDVKVSSLFLLFLQRGKRREKTSFSTIRSKIKRNLPAENFCQKICTDREQLFLTHAYTHAHFVRNYLITNPTASAKLLWHGILVDTCLL